MKATIKNKETNEIIEFEFNVYIPWHKQETDQNLSHEAFKDCENVNISREENIITCSNEKYESTLSYADIEEATKALYPLFALAKKEKRIIRVDDQLDFKKLISEGLKQIEEAKPYQISKGFDEKKKGKRPYYNKNRPF